MDRSKNQLSEMLIHERDGTIRERNSCGYNYYQHKD